MNINIDYLFLLLPLTLGFACAYNWLAYGHPLKCSDYENSFSYSRNGNR